MPSLFDFQPSPQQAAFFDFAGTGQGNGALEACAGAGKTTTLVQGLGRMRGTKFLGAFNKATAGELQRRVKADDLASHAVTSTMHSAGFTAWRQRHPKATLDQRKTRRVFREIAAQATRPFAERYADFACDMVHFAMSAGIGLDDPREIEDDKRWKAIADHFDADRALDKKLTNIDSGVQWARATFKRSLETCPEVLSFDEMLYAPLFSGLSLQRFDNVLIDEAQDSNLPRVLLAERMLADGGRLFAVGDRRQSIYGFAGADASAMANIIERFDATVLPLSVSFRCPRSVVLYAQQFVGPHIEPAADAADGVTRRIGLWPGWWREDKPASLDAILCRYNAPLVKLAFSLIRDGVPCRMAGHDDLGASLKRLAQRWNSRTLDALEAQLQSWLADEIAAAKKHDKPERANAAQDLVDTMEVLIERCRESKRYEVADLVVEISRLFVRPDQPAVLLSSIHKAKGKEWPRVYWMQVVPRFRGSQQEWQQGQEMNLKYVAATRAMQELVLVQE